MGLFCAAFFVVLVEKACGDFDAGQVSGVGVDYFVCFCKQVEEGEVVWGEA